jgi:hypothetical protein
LPFFLPESEGMSVFERVVRAEGIEPSTPAWKAGVLPLNYARAGRSASITGLTHRVKL